MENYGDKLGKISSVDCLIIIFSFSIFRRLFGSTEVHVPVPREALRSKSGGRLVKRNLKGTSLMKKNKTDKKRLDNRKIERKIKF